MNSSSNPTATPETLLASVKGLNGRDPLPNMNRLYALQLDNFFPTATDLMLRKGVRTYHNCYDQEHRDRLNFTRLFSYIPSNNGGVDNSCLVAVGGEGFVELPATPSTEPISRIDSYATNRQWRAVNFTNSAGSWLWCCCGDGTNKARVFNGDEWKILGEDEDDDMPLSFSTEIYDVCSFKRRLWLARRDSTTLYYLDVLAIAGSVEEQSMYSMPIGSLWDKGGYIIKIMNLTLDGGEGSDDYLCVFSSEGQIAMYKGTDPNGQDDWELVGVYNTSRPIGRNCFVKFGGDVIFMSEQGLVAVSSLVQNNVIEREKEEQTTTRKLFKSDIIQPIWKQAVDNLKIIGKDIGLSFQQVGDYCDLTLYPAQSMLICNFLYWYQLTGNEERANFIQYVMNTETGAWCRFKDINCSGFVEHKGDVYCVGERKMYKFWEGFADNSVKITGTLKTAYVFPSGRGTNSRITLMRPIIQSQSAYTKYRLLIDTDYAEQGRIGYIRVNRAGEGGVWDENFWDEAVWDGRGLVSHQWATVRHYPGKAISIRFRIASVGQEIHLIGFDAISQTGGMI